MQPEQLDQHFLKDAEVIYGNTLGLIDGFKFDKIVANIPFSISEPENIKLISIQSL